MIERMNKWVLKHKKGVARFILIGIIITAFLLGLMTGILIKKDNEIKANAEEITNTQNVYINLNFPQLWEDNEHLYLIAEIPMLYTTTTNGFTDLYLQTKAGSVLLNTQSKMFEIGTYMDGSTQYINTMEMYVTMGSIWQRVEYKFINKIEMYVNTGLKGTQDWNYVIGKIYVEKENGEEEVYTMTIDGNTIGAMFWTEHYDMYKIMDVNLIDTRQAINTNLYYENGYNKGYIEGKTEGYETGRTAGYTKGYQDGTKTAENGDFLTLMDAVFYAPQKALFGLLNFDILGFNMYQLCIGIVGALLTIAVVKLILPFI